jgi:hypothetical protein
MNLTQQLNLIFYPEWYSNSASQWQVKSVPEVCPQEEIVETGTREYELLRQRLSADFSYLTQGSEYGAVPDWPFVGRIF